MSQGGQVKRIGLIATAMGAALAWGGPAAAATVLLSCENADNKGFPISINLDAKTATTRGEGFASVLVGENQIRFFFPNVGGIAEFDVSRVTLQSRDRFVSMDASAMSRFRAMPRNTPAENEAAARAMDAALVGNNTGWMPDMVCRKADRAF